MPTTRPGKKRQRRSVLDPEYRALIERVESLPENQSGADKTWVEDLLRETRNHYARARRVR
jgi:hypothetical protein